MCTEPWQEVFINSQALVAASHDVAAAATAVQCQQQRQQQYE
jgi:hypothetical protein